MELALAPSLGDLAGSMPFRNPEPPLPTGRLFPAVPRHRLCVLGVGVLPECGEGENAPTGDYAGLGRCGWITTGVTLNAQAKPERGSYRLGNCPQRGDAQPFS